MTKEEIFDYVMESPENTNPAVLRSMLSELSGGGGGGALELVTFTGEDDTSSCDKTFSEIDAMAVPIGTINGGLFLLQKKNAPSGYKFVGYALIEASDTEITCARCEVTNASVTVTTYTLAGA